MSTRAWRAANARANQAHKEKEAAERAERKAQLAEAKARVSLLADDSIENIARLYGDEVAKQALATREHLERKRTEIRERAAADRREVLQLRKAGEPVPERLAAAIKYLDAARDRRRRFRGAKPRVELPRFLVLAMHAARPEVSRAWKQELDADVLVVREMLQRARGTGTWSLSSRAAWLKWLRNAGERAHESERPAVSRLLALGACLSNPEWDTLGLGE